MKKAVDKSGIIKRATVHTLRHSFANHLLKSWYDIRTIQNLLGHKDVNTTMIYTHVTRKDLLQISNPLDSALQKLSQTDKTNTNVLLSRNLNR